MRVVVLGIGNILLSDEGVGVRAIEHLQETHLLPDEVEAVDGGTAGIELVAYIAGADRLIVVDAVRVGQPPASVVRMEGEAVPAFFRTRISPHQVGLSDLLATLTLTGEAPNEVVLIGVQPVSMATGMALSPEVAARLDEVVGMVVAEIRRIGLAAVRRAA